ncbi:MAG: GrdX family protein [Bacillota bacterium]|jgi:hypothetical protein
MNKAFILSNNPKVWAAFSNVRQVNGTLRKVLLEARTLVHQGCILVTHPLAGSIKPNQTPYKSLIMAKKEGKTDYISLNYIESAISICDSFPNQERNRGHKVNEDFQLIDMFLLQSALESLPAGLIINKQRGGNDWGL